jgi:hypothetical protein
MFHEYGDRPKILFSDPINNIFARILAYQRQLWKLMYTVPNQQIR